MQAPPSWGFLREVSLAGTRVLASSLWRTALAHYTWTLVSVSLHPPTHSAKPMPSTTQLLVIDPQNDFCDLPEDWCPGGQRPRSEEHTSELQSQSNLVCRLLLE